MSTQPEAKKRNAPGTSDAPRADWVADLLSIESGVDDVDVARLAAMPALEYPRARRERELRGTEQPAAKPAAVELRPVACSRNGGSVG